MTLSNNSIQLIKLKDSLPWPDEHCLINFTECKGLFFGKIVNFSSTHFYLEMFNEANNIAIIPHSWIQFMAPLNEKGLERFKDRYNRREKRE